MGMPCRRMRFARQWLNTASCRSKASSIGEMPLTTAAWLSLSSWSGVDSEDEDEKEEEEEGLLKRVGVGMVESDSAMSSDNVGVEVIEKEPDEEEEFNNSGVVIEDDEDDDDDDEDESINLFGVNSLFVGVVVVVVVVDIVESI